MTPLEDPRPSTTITTERLGDGVRYVLPVRDLGVLRIVGWVMTLIGVFVAGLAVVLVATQWRQWSGGSAMERLPLVGFAVVLVAFAGVILTAAQFLLRGRSVVEVRGDRLRMIERGGWAWYSWRVRIEDIKSIAVVGQPSGSTSAGPELAALCAITMERAFGKPSPAALGYPRELLQDLGERLAEHCADRGVTPELRSETKTFEGDIEPQLRWSIDSPPEQPSISNIHVREYDDGLRAEAPPGSTGGCAGCSIGCGSVLVIGAGVPVMLGASGQIHTDSQRVLAIAFGVTLFAGAIGFMWLAWRYTRRRAVIEVRRGRLTIDYVGVFGKRRYAWSADELAAVVCGNSGTKINDRPLRELQVRPKGGGKVGFFEGRDDDELLWLAYRLHHALGLAEPGDPMADDDDELEDPADDDR
ncbi:MAG: hypothetical protein GC159_23570 [Phycisphaera sp.]|nr:hypothetical protein [Phycisphaera sp.]